MRPTDLVSLPEDWAMTTVGKSIELKRGVSWSKNQEHDRVAAGRTPVIRIGNVQSRLELDDLIYLSGIDNETKLAKRVEKGWTILVGSNGNRARIGNAVLYRDEAELLFASFLVGAKPNARSGLDPAYFYRWLSSEQVQAYLSASAESTTGLANLSHNFLKKMTIPKPPIEEQATIARVLDAVDTALERIRRAAVLALDYRRGLVQRVFSEGLYGEEQRKTPIGDIPKSWQVVPVRSVVDEFQYGLSVGMEESGSLPILRMGNIRDGGISFHDVKYVSLPEEVTKPYLLSRGDVLFNRTNSQEWVGKIGIYRCDRKAVFASYLIRLRHKVARINPYFLGHVLGSYSAQCRIKRFATPGVQQVNVNATNLGRVLIPLPVGERGLLEQRQIGTLLEAVESQIRSYEPILVAHEALRRSLMHDLLTGKVRVGDIAQEGAS